METLIMTSRNIVLNSLTRVVYFGRFQIFLRTSESTCTIHWGDAPILLPGETGEGPVFTSAQADSCSAPRAKWELRVELGQSAGSWLIHEVCHIYFICICLFAESRLFIFACWRVKGPGKSDPPWRGLGVNEVTGRDSPNKKAAQQNERIRQGLT